MNEPILEPIKAYYGEFRDKHRQLAEQYFDGLVKASGVSVEQNAALVSERNDAVAKMNVANASLRKQKSLKAFLAVLATLLFIGGIITCFALWTSDLQWLGITLAVFGAAIFVLLIVVICVLLNKRIKQGGTEVDKFRQKADEIEHRAWEQMRPLNAKYDWNIPDEIIYRTVPQIQLDKYFDEDKLDYFDKRCKLGAYDESSSALCVKSGNSNGRPFLIVRFLRQSMEAHTYTGSRIVTWTDWETDSQGHRRSVTRSETLVASVVKPKPVYRYVNFLFYGSDNAACELHFDRSPTVMPNASDKDIDNFVKKGAKELEKKARRAVSDGGDFNKLANSEFEVLFGAIDRDNEVQFRLMFTPLAQKNMVELLRSKQTYGDDFWFRKSGSVNVISSAHGSRLAIDANPELFVNYDLAKARKNFVDFNCEYFRSLYFDFAPLFSIPLYTQEPPLYKYGVCTKPGNIGGWEAESVANYFDVKQLAHPATSTHVILKAQTTTEKDFTVAHVTAHSFEAVPQIEYVPTPCINGHIYEVPVPWTLYQPLERTSDIVMQATNLSREQFDGNNKDGVLFVSGIKAKMV